MKSYILNHIILTAGTQVPSLAVSQGMTCKKEGTCYILSPSEKFGVYKCGTLNPRVSESKFISEEGAMKKIA